LQDFGIFQFAFVALNSSSKHDSVIHVKVFYILSCTNYDE